MKVYLYDPTKQPSLPRCVGCYQPSMRGFGPPICWPCSLIRLRHIHRRQMADNYRRFKAKREARP